MVSYVYICGALLTTWNIVFNLLFEIDLILVTAQQLSLVTRPDQYEACLLLHVTLIPTEDPYRLTRVVTPAS